MLNTLRAAIVGLAILDTVSAVSLSSFTPRIDISNAQCRAAYTTTIDGCTPADFTPNARCSSACVQGLNKIGDVVKRVCKDVDVGETSIIGVFQNNIGIAALCPGVTVTTVSSTTSSTKPPAQASTQPPVSKATTTTTSAAPPPSSLTTLASSSSSTSQSEAVESSSTSSQGIATDPNITSNPGSSPTNIAPPAATSRAATSPPRAPNAQLSNADSGGGSPFDVQATGTSPQLESVSMSMAALLGVALLFGGWA